VRDSKPSEPALGLPAPGILHKVARLGGGAGRPAAPPGRQPVPRTSLGLPAPGILHGTVARRGGVRAPELARSLALRLGHSARARARRGEIREGSSRHERSGRKKKRIRALHNPELAVALHKFHASAKRKCRHCSRPSSFGWCIAKTTARLRQNIFQE
jgi:hypothetical protein